MLIVSNALLMSSDTVIVRSGGLFWLKTVAMVLFMMCSAVLVEWFYVLEEPDVDFIRPRGVVVFVLLYCRLDLCCGECCVRHSGGCAGV